MDSCVLAGQTGGAIRLSLIFLPACRRHGGRFLFASWQKGRLVNNKAEVLHPGKKR